MPFGSMSLPRWRDGSRTAAGYHHRFQVARSQWEPGPSNTTGADITQRAGTMLNAGAGTINLTTPPITGANMAHRGPTF